MSSLNAPDPVLEQLEQVLETSQFPAEVKQRGARILSRLKSPVEIVVLGAEGSGKSSLIHMLLGERAIPKEARARMVEVSYGDTPAIEIEWPDGTVEQHEDLTETLAVSASVDFIRVQLPNPMLAKLNFTEVTLSGHPDQQRKAVDWATKRADLVLWCSQTFDDHQQILWATVQDELKDHSFLVLTMADQLLMKGILPDRIAEVETTAADEFFGLYPVATIQAIAARAADNQTNTNLWNSSGGQAVLDAIMRQVETGRNADNDNALLFLNRYHQASVQTNPAPAAVRAKMPELPGPVRSPEFDTGNVARIVDEVPNNNAGIVKEALAHLHCHAETMIKALADEPPDNPAVILDQCVDAANALAEIVMKAESDDPALVNIQDDLMQSADMMVLFQLEKTEDAAIDAVTLLIQMKKEMGENSIC